MFLIAVAVIIITLLAYNYHKSIKDPKPVVKLMVWGMQLSEESAGQRAMIEEFERRHPGIDVSLLSMGAGTMNPQKLMTAIVGKKPPDVIRQDRFTIGDWASRGTFRPLDDLIARDRDKPNGIRREEYYEFSFLEASYKGKVYAIPDSTDTRFLYYNRGLFREAGIDPYSPPETWEELLEYAKKLTLYNKDGSFKQVGFIPNYGNSWLYLYSWQNGGEFMSKDGRKCTLNNKHTEDALKYLTSIYDALKGAESLDRYSQGFKSEELDPFLTGRVAMKIDVDQCMAGTIARYAPDMDFGVAPAPIPAERHRQTYPNFIIKGLDVPRHVPEAEYKNFPKPEKGRFNGQPRYITWSGGFSYAIPKGSKNVELAWEFIKWMNSPEARLIEAQAQRDYNKSKGRPYLPAIHANRKVNDAVFAEFGGPNPKFRESFGFARELMSGVIF